MCGYPSPPVEDGDYPFNECPCCRGESLCACPHTKTNEADPNDGMTCCACFQAGADRACDNCDCAIHS